MSDEAQRSAPIAAPSNDAAPQAVSEQPSQVAKTEAPDPKLDLYARKEKQLLKMRREFEEQKKAWEAEKSGYIPKSRFKEDSLSALAEVDLDYQKLTETVLNQPNINDPTIRALQQRVRAMEEAESNRTRQAQAQQQQQYEQAKKQMSSDVKLTTNGSPDFELIEKWGAHDLVVERIEKSFNEDGIIMDTKEACRAVEEYLMTEALKAYETNKIKERLKPKEETIPAEVAAATKLKQQNVSVTPAQIKTLTNRMSQEAPQRTSDKERIERAKAAFRGELK